MLTNSNPITGPFLIGRPLLGSGWRVIHPKLGTVWTCATRNAARRMAADFNRCILRRVQLTGIGTYVLQYTYPAGFGVHEITYLPHEVPMLRALCAYKGTTLEILRNA